MNISRRELLKLFPALAASLLMPPVLAHALGSAPSGSDKYRLLASTGKNLCVLDIRKNTIIHTIPLEFIPHGFAQSPTNPDRVWTFQRHNYDTIQGMRIVRKGFYISKGAEVDVVTGKVTQQIAAEPGSVFRGHGLIAPAGNVVYVARVLEKESAPLERGQGGFLTGYDIKTGKVVADHHVSSRGVHECKLMPDGTAFVVASGTQALPPPPLNVCFIRLDLASGKQLSTTKVAHEEQRVGHFTILSDGTIFATSQTDAGSISPNIYMGREGETLQALEYNEAVPASNRSGMLFSHVVYEEDGIAAVTDQGTSSVLLVDIRKRKFIKKVDFPKPWGVALDRKSKQFIVSGQNLDTLDLHLEHAEAMLPHSPENDFGGGHSLLI